MPLNDRSGMVYGAECLSAQGAGLEQQGKRRRMETERLDSDGNSSSDSGDTVDSSAGEVPTEVDIFSDDTPLACGLEDVDICESCQ